MKEEILTLDDLWGSQVDSINWDITTRKLRIFITIHCRDGSRTGNLIFHDVQSFSAQDQRENEAEWDYTELTSIWSNSLSDGYLDVQCEFWSTCNILIIRCASIKISQFEMRLK